MVDPAPQEPWLPLSFRNDPERARELEILHEGVPSWLRESLVRWIKKLVRVRNSYASWTDWDPEIRTRIEASLRREMPDSVSDFSEGECLDAIDYILRQTDICQSADVEYLEARLSEGGSVWRATQLGLQKRVDETLQALGESSLAAETRPAQHLRDAWHRAWGRDPDPSGAYREAVRAVEAAYAPIVSPDNERATLGTIIANTLDKPSKFSVRLRADEPDENVRRLVAMLQTLWKSQLDRHGNSGADVPLNVSLEEAQDAVAIATTLVHLAQQGGFTAKGR